MPTDQIARLRRKRVTSAASLPATRLRIPMPPIKAAPPPASPEEQLRAILVPLSAAALQASVAVYKWGLSNRQLMRAGVVMDLCGDVVRELNGILGHAATVAAVVPTSGASQLAANPAMVKGGGK